MFRALCLSNQIWNMSEVNIKLSTSEPLWACCWKRSHSRLCSSLNGLSYSGISWCPDVSRLPFGHQKPCGGRIKNLTRGKRSGNLLRVSCIVGDIYKCSAAAHFSPTVNQITPKSAFYAEVLRMTSVRRFSENKVWYFLYFRVKL